MDIVERLRDTAMNGYRTIDDDVRNHMVLAAQEIERLRATAEKHGQCSDAQVMEWAERHDLKGGLTDLRCAFDDAASMTPNE